MLHREMSKQTRRFRWLRYRATMLMSPWWQQEPPKQTPTKTKQNSKLVKTENVLNPVKNTSFRNNYKSVFSLLIWPLLQVSSAPPVWKKFGVFLANYVHIYLNRGFNYWTNSKQIPSIWPILAVLAPSTFSPGRLTSTSVTQSGKQLLLMTNYIMLLYANSDL